MSSFRHRRKLLCLLVAMALASPAAQADVYEDAWQCAAATVDGIKLVVSTGAKALEFVTTKPDCMSRLGSPATAAPIGLVVGLSNAGVLAIKQPECSAEVFTMAAKPIAAGLNAVLGELGVLPAPAQKQLAEIAAGEISGALLAEIPGIETFTGSLTCGCDLVDVGLSIEAIKEVVNTADKIGDACGGPVWAKTKEIVGDIGEFAGDAAEEGVRQVSNLGDAIAGQTKHIGLQQYFDENWAPNVEHYAAAEFAAPGSWHGARNWKGLWDPCVAYFDTHTMSEDNSQDTCDDMRSGTSFENGQFAGNGFQQRMFRRVFDFAVTGAVDAARAQAQVDLADLKPKFDIPQPIVDDSDAYAQIAIESHKVRPAMVKAAINQVFGIATKEKRHNGLTVANSTPPTTWAEGTVGDRAAYFYDEVKVGAGDGPADAAKAVQLAMSDIDVETQARLAAGTQMLAFYNKQYSMILMSREIVRDRDQETVDALVKKCPSQSCKEQIASEYAACRAQTKDWYDENAALIGDFDSSAGKAAGAEWTSRVAACLQQARATEVDGRYHINDPIVPTDEPVHVPTGPGLPGGNINLGDRTGGSDAGAITRERYQRDLVERVDPIEQVEAMPKREVLERDPRLDRSFEQRREPVEEAVPSPREDALKLRRDSMRRDPRLDRVIEQRTAPVEEAAPAERVDALQLRRDRLQRESLNRTVREPLTVAPAVDTEAATDNPVRGDELPGCSAVRGAMRPRIYQCQSESAYSQCLVTVRRDSNVQCQNTARLRMR